MDRGRDITFRLSGRRNLGQTSKDVVLDRFGPLTCCFSLLACRISPPRTRSACRSAGMHAEEGTDHGPDDCAGGRDDP